MRDSDIDRIEMSADISPTNLHEDSDRHGCLVLLLSRLPDFEHREYLVFWPY